jgi:hypothetical protein
MNRLKIGSKVLCQLFNTPDNKFYGDYFEGVVTDIYPSWAFTSTMFEKGFRIKRENEHSITVKRKEIKRILS